MASAGSILGNAVLRLEDPTLLTGEGKYVDDLVEPGMLHVSFVRSSVAHGTVTSVDVSEAENMPGVRAIYHAGNNMGLGTMNGFPMMPPALDRPIFAADRVRFVGDIIAAVVAETKTQAADAAEAVIVDIDALPAVTSAVDAMKLDAPLLFPDHGSNVCFAINHGEDATPLEGADVVAEVSMVSQRLAGVPMENNGLLAVPRPMARCCAGFPTRRPTPLTQPLPRCLAWSRASCAWCARGSVAASARRPRSMWSTSWRRRLR